MEEDGFGFEMPHRILQSYLASMVHVTHLLFFFSSVMSLAFPDLHVLCVHYVSGGTAGDVCSSSLECLAMSIIFPF